MSMIRMRDNTLWSQSNTAYTGTRLKLLRRPLARKKKWNVCRQHWRTISPPSAQDQRVGHPIMASPPTGITFCPSADQDPKERAKSFFIASPPTFITRAVVSIKKSKGVNEIFVELFHGILEISLHLLEVFILLCHLFPWLISLAYNVLPSSFLHVSLQLELFLIGDYYSRGFG